MLEFLRKSTGGWIAKFIIGLIVIAFAGFGVNDMLQVKQNTTLSTVGEVTLTTTEFRKNFERQKTAFSRRVRQPITNEQARALGLDRTVLDTMIGGAALDNHAKDLGLTISEDQLNDSILNDPLFKDTSGNFSKDRFIQLLHDNGFSEKEYIRVERTGKIRNQLTKTMTGMVHIPSVLSQAAYKHDHEQRTLKYFTLSEKRIAKIKNPADDVLKTYYEARMAQYKAPEYRKLSFLKLSIPDLQKTIKVDPAKVKAAYEKNKATYGTPEKRHVLQLLFPDVKAATEARKTLKTEKDFIALAGKRKITKDDYDLGLTTLDAMVDPKVGVATFKLKKGEISPVITGEFVTTLIYVKEIQKAVTKTLKDVEKKITEELASEEAKNKASTLLDQIEKERGTGKKISNIATTLKLPFTDGIITDRDGKDQAGKKIDNIDLRLLEEAFRTEVGQQADPIELNQDSVAWYSLADVIPSKNKELSEVKEAVIADWKENEKLQAMNKLSTAIVKEIKGGGSLEKMAKKYRAKLVSTKPLKRSDKDDKLAPALIAQAFMLDKNNASSARSKDGKTRVIFEVSNISFPTDKDEKAVKSIHDALVNVYQNDFLESYLKDLKKTYKVSTDMSLFKKITNRN